MSSTNSTSILRKFGWCVPVALVIGAACSDAGDSGGRTTGSGGASSSASGSGTSTATSGTATGSGNTVGTGSTGSTGSDTSSTASGAGGATSTTTGTAGSTVAGPVTGAGGAATTGSGGSGGSSTGTGGAGSQDAGPIVSDGGGLGAQYGDRTCGAGVVYNGGTGRCATAGNYIVAKGTALTIANFEDVVLATTNHNTIFFGDGRKGNFIHLRSADATATNMFPTVAQTTAIAGGGMTWALHYTGTYASGVMPGFAVPVNNCYDMRAYKGVSFWIKGNPAAGNNMIKFQVHTPVAQPAPSGACSAADAAAGKCDDHYGVFLPITANWTRQIVRWADLKQNCASGGTANFNPAQYNEMFSWAFPKMGAGFDVWFDDFTFDTGDLVTNTVTDIVSEATFNELWSTEDSVTGMARSLRNPFYTYQGMLTAISSFSGLMTMGTPAVRRLEAAAFFSNIAHESDSLGIIEEKGCENDRTCTQYGGVSPGGLTYHGRGPIQLTWPANYTAAGNAIGQNLVNNPEIVATDPAVAWKTGIWFWMGGVSGGATTPHGSITAAGSTGLGPTIRIINGIECDGGNAPAIQDRLRHFRRFSYMFGFDPGALASGC